MNRTDGLVRRNINRSATENGTSEGNTSTANSVDENDVIINDDNDVDDTDSKETRLTLMEEVLLLGLKDKEVKHSLLFLRAKKQFNGMPIH